MANKFKNGDLVVLKAGGPPMVMDASPGEGGPYSQLTEYRCEWFKGASKQHGSFAEHVLEAYVKPTK